MTNSKRVRRNKTSHSAVPPSRPDRVLEYLSITAVTPHPQNPRKHSSQQIRAIARSIGSFDFNAPILVDKNNVILGGHGRFEAAKLLGSTRIPIVRLDHLSEEQARAYMLADNKLTDRSSFDDATVKIHLRELSELVLDFELEATGFETPEIDFHLQSSDEADAGDDHDEFQLAKGPAVSAPGDLWRLGGHRVLCGSALDVVAYKQLFDGEVRKAAAVFTDPPYNVVINGHATGNGRITHREFPMASGEMSDAEFTNFLKTAVLHIAANTAMAP